MIELNNANIQNWRENWKKKGNKKLLSIVGLTNQNDIIKEAVKRGYAPSVQNTALKKGKYGTEKLQRVRKGICNDVESAIGELFAKSKVSAQDFGEWERNLAEKIRQHYHQNGIVSYTFGNAQKWINMAIKYIFSADGTDWGNAIFDVCYLPIDITVMRSAKKAFGLKPLSKAWSTCDDWDEIKKYQEDLEKKIIEKYPNPQCSRLWWECNIW